jgi:carbon-monoxide dehydrogenase medium subunit
MKPAPFEYAAPDTLSQALALKAEHGDEAKWLAGGQSLIPTLNFRVAQPRWLIDINSLADLSFIRREAHELRIGALTRQSRVERDPLVAEQAPLVHAAVPYIAHPQIRNRGTFGGSLAHADPAAETPVLLLALSGRVRAQSARGGRWIEAADFMLGPFTTALEPDELLTEIALPVQPPGTGSAFLEVSRRHGDYAMLGAAAVLRLGPQGTIAHARLVFLNAGETPIRSLAAEAVLLGQTPGAELFAAAARAADVDLQPLGTLHATVAYQRHLAAVVAQRVLEQASLRAVRSRL